MTSLYTLSQSALGDSAEWFPKTAHNPFFTAACVAGEVGEVLNLLKKVERGSHTFETVEVDVREEVADVFTYLLMLAAQLNMDLEEAYWQKRAANQTRFSARQALEEGAGHRTQIIPRIQDMNLNPAGDGRFA